MKRQRGRSRRSGGGNNLNRHFESNGPDVKIRGSAQQVLDKYLQYARDAQTSGDRVMSEAYFQHAEHYQRLLSAMQAREKPKRERESSSDEDEESGAEESDADGARDDDRKPARKPRSDRQKRQKEEEGANDPLTVIDGDGEDGAAAEARDGAGEKPKTRRRSYRKRDSDADAPADASSADDEADAGVMKTLSRGHASPSAEETGETDETPTPAAAEQN